MTYNRREDILKQIANHQLVISEIHNNGGILDFIDSATKIIVDAFNNGHKVWFCGNGGSAADAQHLASELSGKFYLDRKALPAEALHTNTSFVTAVGNDYGFDHIYTRALEAHAASGDVLILLSTSGTSPNIINALHTAQNMDIISIVMTGDFNNPLRSDADHCMVIPSQDTPRIQEAMMLIGHILCCEIEKRMFVK